MSRRGSEAAAKGRTCLLEMMVVRRAWETRHLACGRFATGLSSTPVVGVCKGGVVLGFVYEEAQGKSSPELLRATSVVVEAVPRVLFPSKHTTIPTTTTATGTRRTNRPPGLPILHRRPPFCPSLWPGPEPTPAVITPPSPTTLHRQGKRAGPLVHDNKPPAAGHNGERNTYDSLTRRTFS